MGYDNFKTKVCAYYNVGNASSKLPQMKDALDKIITQELPQRDSDFLFLVRDMKNSTDLNLSIEYKNVMCFYSEEEKALMSGVVCPNWRNGWRGISKDSFVADQIGDLFHFISQYIYRSYQVNLIGAIALSTGRPTDFRGRTLSCSYGSQATEKSADFGNKAKEKSSELSLKTSGYLRLINALDPFVNKSIFYYVKSLDLNEHDFIEDSLAAADNMIDVIFQSIKTRMNKPTQDRKGMCDYVYKEIGFYDQRNKHNLERLYLLRCAFTAHPTRSKWWDFYEIYEEDIDQIIKSVRSFLISYLKYENKNRLIEVHPLKWSQWFMDNCDAVYDAVWFHDLP